MRKLNNLEIGQIKSNVQRNFDRFLASREDPDWFCKCYIMAIRDFCEDNNLNIGDLLVLNPRTREYE